MASEGSVSRKDNGASMLEDSWSLYEAPHPRKWIFHPRKRRVMAPLLTIAAAAMVVFEAVSRL